MLELQGGAALSEFRRTELLNLLRVRVPAIQNMSAQFVHFVDQSAPLGVEQDSLLQAILIYGRANAPMESDVPRDGGHPDQELIVIPRFGTISPWSSKASDIAQICGLTNVRRIERGIAYGLGLDRPLKTGELEDIAAALHDRMTESVVLGREQLNRLFTTHEPVALGHIPLLAQGRRAIDTANGELGLALSNAEIDYLVEKFRALERDPTDAELMMFAQANSEHCRHKIFNARWIIDGVEQDESLFDMIRSTHATNPDGVLSAYVDNSAVIEGGPASRIVSNPEGHEYCLINAPVHTLMKVETHNHPTAIAPFAGAATGNGGEIRDEGATGLGARPKAGLTGFSVSHLRLPGAGQPWEKNLGKPDRIASALEIMLEGPIGGAAFNNEFGRPNILGYFRTFESPDETNTDHAWGYHKPIMIAGGIGNIREEDVLKGDVPSGSLLIVLGGPAMLIGLGGGAASSMGSGSSSEDLDFASVQRGNPEMQRRAQGVIDGCWAVGLTGGANPLLIIHDVGAGGLSNAVPELVDHSHRGAVVELRDIPNAESGMSPLEIWCNEAQERYVLAIAPDHLDWFETLCRRERCPYAVIGRLNDTGELHVTDRVTGDSPVQMPLEILLGKVPQTVMQIKRSRIRPPGADFSGLDIEEACRRVLQFPTVADKSFLIHIGDRTVGGLVARDQLVGPWQVPVSDVAVTTLDYQGYRGEAMAMGERTPVAVLNPAASGRLAIGEALTNLAAADIGSVDKVRMSANWMAANGVAGEDEALRETVEAVAGLCRELRVAIPVGKDSLSMQTRWKKNGREFAVVAPVSLIISAFAPVGDARHTLTPQLVDKPATCLYLIDIGAGQNRLGGSCLGQCFNLTGGQPPDLDEPQRLIGFFNAIRQLDNLELLLAYHDRSDGGLFATLCEMAFAGRTGLNIDLETDSAGSAGPLAVMFAEELGAVIQINESDISTVEEVLARHGLGNLSRRLGCVTAGDRLCFDLGDGVLEFSRTELHRAWSSVSYRMQALRDNPDTALEAYDVIIDAQDPGLSPALKFSLDENPAAPFIDSGNRPRVAILREQGTNGHVEMAAAFYRAGFQPVDVHMSDVLSGQTDFDTFTGLVACGGFSYGDVLGAGGGWAKSILFNPRSRAQFERYFARPDSFTLGVCNGCQMLAALSEIIPGADHWPGFAQNISEQFEARLSLVEVMDSTSVFLQGMAGSRLLIASSHGEGRAEFSTLDDLSQLTRAGQLAVRYVDNYGRPTIAYPANPNGSQEGTAGLCSKDGRVTIMMPHPERVFRAVQHSWSPDGWGEDGPWMRMFQNARAWVG